MYALVVRSTVPPGQLEVLDPVVAETIRGIRASEPGTVIHLSHERAPQTRRFLAERVQDDQLADDHRTTEDSTRGDHEVDQ